MKLLGKTVLILTALLVALAAAAVGSGLTRPALGIMEGQFSYIKVWDEFGVAIEGNAAAANGFLVSSIRDVASGGALKALWDGSSLLYDEKASSWEIPLSIGSGTGAQKAKLVSDWTDKAPFPWGLATVGIEGQLIDPKAAYSADISLIGSHAFVPEDSSFAVMKSAARDKDGLFAYLIARPSAQTSSFKASVIKKGSATAGIIGFELTLSGAKPLAGEQAAELTVIRAMADEDAMSLGEAWVASYARPDAKRPDVRLTGTVDKPKVNPGEAVRYTYYLFNAGMDQAKGLSVSIPVPQGGKLVKGSIKGDNGKAVLYPSGAAIDLGAGTDADTGAYEGATEISWAPSGNLRPGAVIKFSFDFLVRK